MSNFDVSSELNKFYPPDRPVRVHTVLATVNGGSDTIVTPRSLHTCLGLNSLLASHAVARWRECTILFVPSIDMSGHSATITAACTSSTTAPTTCTSLKNTNTCVIHQSGGDGTLPAIVRHSINFVDAGVSPLIRPTPHVLPQPTIIFNIDTTKDAPSTETIYTVYLTGVIEFAGAAPT